MVTAKPGWTRSSVGCCSDRSVWIDSSYPHHSSVYRCGSKAWRRRLWQVTQLVGSSQTLGLHHPERWPLFYWACVQESKVPASPWSFVSMQMIWGEWEKGIFPIFSQTLFSFTEQASLINTLWSSQPIGPSRNQCTVSKERPQGNRDTGATSGSQPLKPTT